MSSGEKIASALHLRPAGQGRWNGRCPSCGYAAGFTVTQRRGEPPLVHCHAGGCAQVELIEALRTLSLWPDTRENTDTRRVHWSRDQRYPAEHRDNARRDQALAAWRRTLPVGPLICRYLSG